jgi:hypothetical protein
MSPDEYKEVLAQWAREQIPGGVAAIVDVKLQFTGSVAFSEHTFQDATLVAVIRYRTSTGVEAEHTASAESGDSDVANIAALLNALFRIADRKETAS